VNIKVYGLGKTIPEQENSMLRALMLALKEELLIALD